MNKILFVDATIRPESRTLTLAKALLEGLEGEVETVRLYEKDLRPLSLEMMKKRDAASRARDFSGDEFSLARQLSLADTVVIAAPYWDLTFPAVLKLYLETVSVSGLTFEYTAEGRPKGLCRAKKLCYVTTAGGFIGENNFGYNYVRALFAGLFGIKESECITAEGLDISPALEEKGMKEALEGIHTCIQRKGLF